MDQLGPLESLRRRLALAVGENAVFDGWTEAAVESAAGQLGIDPAKARLAMPKNASGLIDCYIAGVDRALEQWALANDIAKLKIRDRITQLLLQRLAIMAPAREAVRSALAVLALPQNLPLGLRLSWRTADLMWRLAGDTATDLNHYTKRLTLAAVYGSTLFVWIDDGSEGFVETRGFLERRIADVMEFERVKARWRQSSAQRPSLTRFFGRLRYPPR